MGDLTSIGLFGLSGNWVEQFANCSTVQEMVFLKQDGIIVLNQITSGSRDVSGGYTRFYNGDIWYNSDLPSGVGSTGSKIKLLTIMLFESAYLRALGETPSTKIAYKSHGSDLRLVLTEEAFKVPEPLGLAQFFLAIAEGIYPLITHKDYLLRVQERAKEGKISLASWELKQATIEFKTAQVAREIFEQCRESWLFSKELTEELLGPYRNEAETLVAQQMSGVLNLQRGNWVKIAQQAYCKAHPEDDYSCSPAPIMVNRIDGNRKEVLRAFEQWYGSYKHSDPYSGRWNNLFNLALSKISDPEFQDILDRYDHPDGEDLLFGSI